ncbi:MAG TPA: hypothetical protein VME46_20685, partial [Acidimicrobiales bacterium]|nr:hypothetical protein [Acidimicrobiales bacterium]
VVTAQQLASVPPGMHWTVRAQDVALSLATSPDGEGALSPNLPALAIAGRAGAALPVKDHGTVVGVVLAPDVAAMVARGRPIPRRTWGKAVWPSPSPSPSLSQ